jgi:hypothetical protein
MADLGDNGLYGAELRLMKLMAAVAYIPDLWQGVN